MNKRRRNQSSVVPRLASGEFAPLNALGKRRYQKKAWRAMLTQAAEMGPNLAPDDAAKQPGEDPLD